MNLPNILTFSRMLLTFPVVALLTVENRVSVIISVLLFTIAASTDFFDGYLARKLNQVTDLGKFMDQISDKILITSLFLVFLSLGMINLWLVVVVVVRDIFVSGLRMAAASKGVVIPANYFGKAKTISQIVLIGCLYLILLTGVDFQLLLDVLQWIVGVLTVASGGSYFRISGKIFEGGK